MKISEYEFSIAKQYVKCNLFPIQAYNIAVHFVTPYANLSHEEQLPGIAASLRLYFANNMTYSTSDAHYNNPYGYLVP